MERPDWSGTSPTTGARLAVTLSSFCSSFIWILAFPLLPSYLPLFSFVVFVFQFTLVPGGLGVSFAAGTQTGYREVTVRTGYLDGLTRTQYRARRLGLRTSYPKARVLASLLRGDSSVLLAAILCQTRRHCLFPAEEPCFEVSLFATLNLASTFSAQHYPHRLFHHSGRTGSPDFKILGRLGLTV